MMVIGAYSGGVCHLEFVIFQNFVSIYIILKKFKVYVHGSEHFKKSKINIS